jgi:hypothetical protein
MNSNVKLFRKILHSVRSEYPPGRVLTVNSAFGWKIQIIPNASNCSWRARRIYPRESRDHCLLALKHEHAIRYLAHELLQAEEITGDAPGVLIRACTVACSRAAVLKRPGGERDAHVLCGGTNRESAQRPSFQRFNTEGRKVAGTRFVLL